MNKFKIEVSSDLEYEKMVVNLNYENNQIAILNCDKGINKTEIEILDRYQDRVVWNFNYVDFINAITKAYEKLKQVNEK